MIQQFQQNASAQPSIWRVIAKRQVKRVKSWLREHRESVGYALLLLASLGFSFKPIFIKTIYENYASDPITIVLMRFYISAPLFLLTLVLIEGGRALRPRGRELWLFPLLGIVCLGGATYCSFLAIIHLGASVASLVLFSYPIFVLAILGILDRHIPREQLLAAGLASAGLVLVTGLNGSASSTAASSAGLLTGGAASPVLGFACGIISALCFASYNVMAERLAGHTSPLRQSAFSIFCFTIVGGLALGHRVYPTEAAAWGYATLLAVFAGFLPFLCFLYGMRQLGAGPGTIANLLGPAFTLCWAYAFFGELLSLAQWAGVALIFLGVGSLKSQGLRRWIAGRFKRS